MTDLNSKVALVTGAARGQGRAHSLRLAAAGADIVALDICAQLPTVPYPMPVEEDLAATGEAVRGLGRRVIARKVDVRERQAVDSAVAQALDEFGRIDIVIANAGIAPLELEPTDPEQTWADVIATNLSGAFNTVHAAVPAMIAGGRGGSVVFVGSTAAFKGTLSMKTVGGYAYTASKHGLVGLTRAFAVDLAKHGIRVNAVHPSGVDTPMVNNESMTKLMANRDVSAWTNLLPVGRMQPSDISDAVMWLVSDSARYVTGVALPVDAGFTTK